MKNKILILAFSTLLITSCNKKVDDTKIETTTAETEIKTDSTIAVGDNSQNSLDWNGTYKGTIPCADCEGIAMEITLNKDLTFTSKSVYLGKEKNEFNENGAFSWNKEGSGITTISQNKTTAMYKVGENKLIRLNSEGKENSDSKMADMYVLNKEISN
ncbi:copper resistance protein NlpE [Flavobacterium aquatile]|uniref:Copper resistance protein NlpE n=1 Tax=Flavobacterium aquatile LMG 4008 = ATCC 11947 TaxID=1453498 RepID=A0A095UXL1_9FLAO|nr:copper resistance protein NlpE [Flavobacterium aquatile]KGD67320.1 hypothetical protein LG45_13975 [Flavobacterium aquatile LMG 4008 = ATCC 11947]OXA66788.1 copper homeostasis protein [Flavobacterium aquatile LMG 4008 = ATCC 11947]GEC78504.1 copper resistance protein [Flavobacterium aquatile]